LTYNMDGVFTKMVPIRELAQTTAWMNNFLI
jgi:hypothetical protein